MRWRLSVLMFLQYAVPGAWGPLFTLYLQEQEFTPPERAWACATSALGALAAPLPWGQIADRWLAAQHCISLCAFCGAILLWLLAELTAPVDVFLAALGFWFFMIPVMSLGTALTFRHLPNPERDFGRVRMWGTVGWVAAGLILTHWFADPEYLRWLLSWVRPAHPVSELADAFRLGGALGLVLAVYALTLPHTPPMVRHSANESTQRSWLRSAFGAPLLAMKLFRLGSFRVFCLCLLGLYVTLPFSAQLTPLLLKDLGVPQVWLPLTLTIAQSLEVVTLGMLPIILLRLEEKGTMFLGILAWAIALVILTLGQPPWLVIASLGLHGIFITCFLVAGQVFVNRRSPGDVRASAQALLQVINGMGLLVGHLLVGWIVQMAAGDFTQAFAPAMILAAMLVLVFALGFRPGLDGATPQTPHS